MLAACPAPPLRALALAPAPCKRGTLCSRPLFTLRSEGKRWCTIEEAVSHAASKNLAEKAAAADAAVRAYAAEQAQALSHQWLQLREAGGRGVSGWTRQYAMLARTQTGGAVYSTMLQAGRSRGMIDRTPANVARPPRPTKTRA